MVQRLVPVCLAAILLATACGSAEPATTTPEAQQPPGSELEDDEGAEVPAVPEGTPTTDQQQPPTSEPEGDEVPEEAAGEISLAEELLSELSESGNQLAALQRDPDETAEAHLREVVLYVLTWQDDGDPPTTSQDERRIEAAECYADSFIGTLRQDRLEDVSAALDQHDDLSDGLPLAVLSDGELVQLFVNAAHCANGFLEVLGMELIAPFLALLDSASDAGLALGSNLSACLAGLAHHADFRYTLLEEALFDSPATEQFNLDIILDTCGESFLVPSFVELFVAEDGLEREAAECVVPRLLDLLRNRAPEMLTGGPEDLDDETQLEVSIESLSIYRECDA